MIGVIIKDCFVRDEPSVQADKTGEYNVDDRVNVVRTVEGGDYDAEDIWYEISDGGYIWSGAVNVARDGSGLPKADQIQYLVCYRQRNGNGKPDLNSKEPADELSFAEFSLLSSAEAMRTVELSAEVFAENVKNIVSAIPAEREHVILYIHGYQWISSLKLDLLTQFVQSYMTHSNNKVAKVLFFTWPSQGSLARKSVDDRSISAGRLFTQKDMFEYLEKLSVALADSGRKLNLLVHSFGHQLLNGMLNPGEAHVGKIPTKKLFENIFLMAPDITHLALRKDGAEIYNNFPDDGTDKYHYQFSRLKDIAKKVHIFHDRYDYLLHISTKKFLEKGMRREPAASELDRIREYRALGNYANKMLPEELREPGFTFWDVEDLIRQPEPTDLYDFPFQPQRKGVKKTIDRLWNNSDYGEINILQTLFNVGRSADHHRYVFTCKQVVDKVQELL